MIQIITYLKLDKKNLKQKDWLQHKITQQGLTYRKTYQLINHTNTQNKESGNSLAFAVLWAQIFLNV